MIKTAIVVTSGIFMTEIIWQLYKVYERSQRNRVSNNCTRQLCNNTEAKIFEVMFFSKDSSFCRSHLEYMTPCTKMNCAIRYLRQIINYLDSATDSLDICVYFFTFSELGEAIIKAKNRNVAVRMILDESMAKNDLNQVMNFYKEGIQPKLKPLETLMHHKFVIIDKKILISGSTNWTKSAFFGNFENILVTNESTIVDPFMKEFERIWLMLDSLTTETKFTH